MNETVIKDLRTQIENLKIKIDADKKETDQRIKTFEETLRMLDI